MNLVTNLISVSPFIHSAKWMASSLTWHGIFTIMRDNQGSMGDETWYDFRDNNGAIDRQLIVHC